MKKMNILTEIDKLQKQITAIRPLSEEQIKELNRYYRIGLTYSSNAMEGNTLTETETRIVIENGLTIGGKPLHHHLEATGHAQAYNMVLEMVKNEKLTEDNILNLHSLFYNAIDQKNAGQYRKVRVFISGSKHTFPKPEEVPGLMQQFVSQYKVCPESMHPVVCAAKIHKDFVMIHPFIDGNGRIARLLMNLVLLKNDFPVTIIPPILRLDYIRHLETAHTNDKPFIEFIAGCVKQSQLEYLRLMK